MSLVDDGLKLLTSLAPTIATALGGPLAGLAVQALEEVFGLEPGPKDAVLSAVAGATPDQILALKKADQDFAVRMKELDIDLEKVNAGDRDSARARQIAMHDKTPAVLAYAITVGYFGTLGAMLAWGVPKGSEALYIMLGNLGTAWGGAIAYYFGSSAGSAAKNALIGKDGR